VSTTETYEIYNKLPDSSNTKTENNVALVYTLMYVRNFLIKLHIFDSVFLKFSKSGLGAFLGCVLVMGIPIISIAYNCRKRARNISKYLFII